MAAHRRPCVIASAATIPAAAKIVTISAIMPPMRLPEVTGRPLPEVLAAGIIDLDVLRTGYAIMAARY
jgi:hypothetical protein